MLPGFRFLFGAIVFCFSILVFGLGAAALLRAAHEQFASRPSWYPTPGTKVAQQNEPFAQQGGSSGDVLSLLEVDPDDNDAAREKPHNNTPEPGLQASTPEPAAAATDQAPGNLPDTQKVVAPSALEEPLPTPAAAAEAEAASNVPPPPEPEKLAPVEPETSLGEGSATVEHAAPVAASEPEIRTTPVDTTVSKAIELSTAASEPINVPAVGPEPAAPQIATLGRSPEATEPKAREKEAGSETRAKASRSFSNRLRTQRAAKPQRRLAHRARIARRAPVQQQAPATFATGPATTNGPATENPYRF